MWTLLIPIGLFCKACVCDTQVVRSLLFVLCTLVLAIVVSVLMSAVTSHHQTAPTFVQLKFTQKSYSCLFCLGQTFYLERQFARAMTLIGWNNAAHDLIDATVHAAHYDNKGNSSSTLKNGDKNSIQSSGNGQKDDKKDVKSAKVRPSAINSKNGNKNDTAKSGLYYMSTMSGQGMVVMAIVIGLVSYSIKIFYSR